MAAILPAFDAFAEALSRGENQLIYTRLAADLDTPVSLMLKLAGARPGSFVLESVTGGEVRGRYSIVGMKPDLIWRCFGTRAEVNREARFAPDGFATDAREPLESLRALMAECRMDLPEGLPAASAGLFGYLGYDMIRLVERLPDVNPDPLGLPDAVMMRPTVVAVLDGVKGEVTLCAPVWAADAPAPRAAYAQAAERVMDAVRDLDRAPPPPAPWPRPDPRRSPPATSPGRTTRRLSPAPRSTSRPATSSRWCRRSAGGSPTRPRPSRSTARFGGRTPRPSCSTST